MQNVASEMQMVVDLNNHWQVKYGTSIIMDSLVQNYWPACIDNYHCTNTTVADPSHVTPTTAAMAAGWSTVFRNCPAGAYPTEAEIGGCDGDFTTELNMIKWRVEQAMWMLAASSGVLPGAMFYQPIPGVLTDTNVDAPLPQPNFGHFPIGTTNYYAGSLSQQMSAAACNGASNNLNSVCWQLSESDTNTSVADVALMGALFDIDPAFKAFGGDSNIAQGGNGEVPYWYSLLYSTGQAKHFLAANSPAVFDQCDVTVNGQSSPFAPPTCSPSSSQSASAPTPTEVPLSALVGAAVGLDGVACSQNFGSSTGVSTTTFGSGVPWWTLVGSVKLGINQGSAWGPGANATGDVTELTTSTSAPTKWLNNSHGGAPLQIHLATQTVDIGSAWDNTWDTSAGSSFYWYPADAYRGVLNTTAGV
jgi:hypothetical protein